MTPHRGKGYDLLVGWSFDQYLHFAQYYLREKQMNKPKLKYRVSFTEDEIKTLYGGNVTNEIKSKLKVVLVKIQSDLLQPAFVSVKDKSNLVSDLGFDSPTIESNTPIDFVAKRKQVYELWLQDPLSITTEQLELVETYRYENNLMSPEEETEYTNKLMGV